MKNLTKIALTGIALATASCQVTTPYVNKTDLGEVEVTKTDAYCFVGNEPRALCFYKKDNGNYEAELVDLVNVRVE